MSAYAGTMGGRRRRTGRLGRVLMVLLGSMVAALAVAPVAYMLWPKPVPVAPDAPSLPITIGNVTFNIPPAAIRVAMQRRPGTQARVDLAFLWPSLDPPPPVAKPAQAAKAAPAATPVVIDRLFVTIVGSDNTLAPIERLKSIYPRYLKGTAVVGPDGLTIQEFRSGLPYQGEDLIYDPAAPQQFLLRCTRRMGPTPGMCLHERRFAGADVTVRIPRQWIADWRAVAAGIDRLIAGLRPVSG